MELLKETITNTYWESGKKGFIAYLFTSFSIIFPIVIWLISSEISSAESCGIAGISLGIGLLLSATIIEQNMYKKAKAD
ncbi:MAG: hypothetical protein KAT32_02290 [Candidatus Moranbacteria bacterium]|nr:hypothetical protein [Candidatus Moranbacteria bacterium]